MLDAKLPPPFRKDLKNLIKNRLDGLAVPIDIKETVIAFPTPRPQPTTPPELPFRYPPMPQMQQPTPAPATDAPPPAPDDAAAPRPPRAAFRCGSRSCSARWPALGRVVALLVALRRRDSRRDAKQGGADAADAGKATTPTAAAARRRSPARGAARAARGSRAGPARDGRAAAREPGREGRRRRRAGRPDRGRGPARRSDLRHPAARGGRAARRRAARAPRAARRRSSPSSTGGSSSTGWSARRTRSSRSSRSCSGCRRSACRACSRPSRPPCRPRRCATRPPTCVRRTWPNARPPSDRRWPAALAAPKALSKEHLLDVASTLRARAADQAHLDAGETGDIDLAVELIEERPPAEQAEMLEAMRRADPAKARAVQAALINDQSFERVSDEVLTAAAMAVPTEVLARFLRDVPEVRRDARAVGAAAHGRRVDPGRPVAGRRADAARRSSRRAARCSRRCARRCATAVSRRRAWRSRAEPD